MTAPDPGLTDLIAAEVAKHAHDFGAMWHDDHRACICGRVLREADKQADHVAAHVAELLTETYTITPKLIAKPGIPCGDWADGHSYRKCTRPKGHEGHHG